MRGLAPTELTKWPTWRSILMDDQTKRRCSGPNKSPLTGLRIRFACTLSGDLTIHRKFTPSLMPLTLLQPFCFNFLLLNGHKSKLIVLSPSQIVSEGKLFLIFRTRIQIMHQIVSFQGRCDAKCTYVF